MYALTTALFGLAAVVVAQQTPCTSMLPGYGPTPTPNDETSFKALPAFASAASNAATPSLYQNVFTNLNASEFASSNNVYLGYYALKTYDAGACTAICDNTTGCVGTNLYFERNPTLLPGDACPNPTAMTVIKCALWGSPVTGQAATNDGQWQDQFHVLVAGSNGYMKLPAQACSAISSAWSPSKTGYSWPTSAGAQNWGGPSGFKTTAWPSAATAAGGRQGW
ncbi:hypothetical protein LTR86_007886 [Recurvomyces mirabilis]|nr:hypothetical protein LTR86_007886 [Recurvomyces mirabilis]